MYRIPLLLILFWSSVASAEVVNVEFKFTPYVGDPAKSDQVETVPGIGEAINQLINAPLTPQRRWQWPSRIGNPIEG